MIYGDVIAREGCVQSVKITMKSSFFSARGKFLFFTNHQSWKHQGLQNRFNFDKLVKNFEINFYEIHIFRNRFKIVKIYFDI